MTDLTQLWHDYLKATQTEHGDKDKWHMSSVGHCMRKQVMERAEFDKLPLSPRQMANFRMGEMVHEELYAAWEAAKTYEFTSELRVELPNSNAVGHLDVRKV